MSNHRLWPWVLAGILVSVAGVAALSLMCLAAIGVAAVAAARQKTAQAQPPTDILYEQDVEYGRAEGRPLLLDLARPKSGKGPFPGVVCIHGGGWRGGDKTAYRAFAQNLARRGYVAVTVKYRLAPEHRFPAQLEDVKAAVRYLRANAEDFSLDADRIGAMGGSAGGHLALLLGATDETHGFEGASGHAGHSSRVQAVASVAGPTDLTRPFTPLVEGMLTDLVAADKEKSSRPFAEASPLSYLSQGDAPILAIHGTKDELVPYSQATLLVEAAREAGIEAELVTVENGGHGFGGNLQGWLAANERLIEFFDRHLQRKE